MKQNDKIKITVKKLDSTFGPDYQVASIRGAAEVFRVNSQLLSLPQIAPALRVGDTLSHSELKQLIDNPYNDVTVTL